MRSPIPKSWIDIAESFYRASLILVEGVAADRLNEDTEGIAAAFLFRHYLELSLKNIILAGRFSDERWAERSPGRRSARVGSQVERIVEACFERCETEDGRRPLGQL